tara:strand:- start:406 stop:705 length:300 start_codon:yes stop_codon:yes gene_type:complete
MALINNRFLKGTDWFITPTRNYIKTIKGIKARITLRSEYTSRRGNSYKRTYTVSLGNSFLGTRRSFKDAMILAESKALQIALRDKCIEDSKYLPKLEGV